MSETVGDPIIDCTVTDAAWMRTILQLTVDCGSEVSFSLEQNGRELPLACVRTDEGLFDIVIPVTTVADDEFLGNGCWKLRCSAQGVSASCRISEAFAYRMDEFDRVFRYGEGGFAYTVNLGAYSEDGRNACLQLHSFFMRENRSWKDFVLRNRSFAFLAKCINIIYKLLAHLFPKKGRNILMMCETGDKLWGNLLAVDKRLLARNGAQRYRIRYSYRTRVDRERGIAAWLKLLLQVAQSDYIFLDNYARLFAVIVPDKRTKLIQVWHAGVGFKSVGYARFGRAHSPHPYMSGHRRYDYVLAGSEHLCDVYAEAFGISRDRVLPIGLPRLDGFFDPGQISTGRTAFFASYPETEGKKRILFAPTFRGGDEHTACYDYSALDFERIYDFCGTDTVFLIRMHHFISDRPSLGDFNDRLIDVSDYNDAVGLLRIADVLITDYSSIYYDFAALRRPMIFYTYDRVLYELTRGVHQHIYETAPGKVVNCFEDLMLALNEEDYELEKTIAFAGREFADADEICETVNTGAADTLLDMLGL
jgi:CDP-ribitol ribitolphosphotransferase